MVKQCSPTCTALVKVPPCPACATKKEQARDQANPHRSIYKTRQWQSVRKVVLDRDGHQCVDCGSNRALEVDHVTPLKIGGQPYDVDNLVTYCLDCHRVHDVIKRTLLKRLDAKTKNEK